MCVNRRTTILTFQEHAVVSHVRSPCHVVNVLIGNVACNSSVVTWK